MTARPAIPLAVLSQQLSEAIDNRRVRSAVFTTYSFDPGFFELQVLPLLFDQSFSQVDKVRRIQLEDAMGSLNHLAVYYDQSALAQDGEPAQLDYRRIDLRRRTGCFHPKVILLRRRGVSQSESRPSRLSRWFRGVLRGQGQTLSASQGGRSSGHQRRR